MKKYSLSQKLFRTYVGWFILYLMILVSVTVSFMAFGVKKNIRIIQTQMMQSIDGNVQNYLEKMNTFSMELVNSDEFKKAAIVELPKAYENRENTAALFSAMYKKTYKMLPFEYSIGIVVEDQYYIWMGDHYYISSLENHDIHTYDNLVKNERPIIKCLEKNEYSKETDSREENKSYITLARSMDYQHRYLDGRAILEIHASKEDFVEELRNLSDNASGSGLKINVFDSDGKEIYKESKMDLTSYVKASNIEDFERDGDFIAVSRVFDDNVTIVYTRDSAAYRNKQTGFWGLAIGLSILIIAITFLVTYKISKQISKPIHSMCENVQRINVKDGSGFKEITTDIEELQILSRSLKQMSDQIQESLQQIIMLKDYEVNAKLLALQAQMQPHFLFNTLSTIASIAESEGNISIYRICTNLNGMFRYISSQSDRGVDMYEEIRHVESYVEIMKERFPDSHVEIDIPLEMMMCKIPKLTIQPLVENAFKYCDREKPYIKVTGEMNENGRWTVEVKDNGKGFTAESKEKIMQKCHESLKQENTLSNKIDGMGLVNVYVRLKLFYGDKMSYFIEENEGKIIIGGYTDGARGKL